MKIGVIGNYGATNIGDDAILDSLLKVLESHQVTIFSANPDAWKPTKKTKSVPLFPLGFRSFFKHGLKPSIQALKAVDVVILGGGGLFQDNRLYACFLWAWQLFWVRWFKKPLFIYATGVGPLSTMLGRWLTQLSYRKASQITLRDKASMACLENIGIKKDVHVVADPVFLNNKPDKVQSRTKRLFLISLRPWLKKNQPIIHAFAQFLEYLKEERDAELVFVCMQAEKEDDLQMIKPLMQLVGGRVFFPKSFPELLEAMERAEFAIGMRYHFMIAALIAQTPLIPISYTHKTTDLFEGNPLCERVLPLESINVDVLKNAFKELSIGYNNAIVYQKALAHHLSEMAEDGAKLLQNFLKTVDLKKIK